MIYEAKSGSVDGVATCSRNTVGRESNSISVIGIIGPLTGPFLPFSLHGTRSFTTLCKYFLLRSTLSHWGWERERERGGRKGHERDTGSCLSDVFHTGHAKLLPCSCQSYNYPTPNTWPGDSVPLKMHVRRNRETLLSTWFVLRFRFKVSR